MLIKHNCQYWVAHYIRAWKLVFTTRWCTNFVHKSIDPLQLSCHFCKALKLSKPATIHILINMLIKYNCQHWVAHFIRAWKLVFTTRWCTNFVHKSIDPLQLPCHFCKTLKYFVQVRILAATLEYMGIGNMHYQALSCIFVAQYRCEK